MAYTRKTNRKYNKKGKPMQVVIARPLKHSKVYGPTKVFKFKRFVDGSTITGLSASRFLAQTGSAQYIGLTFRLSDVPAATEFQSLFDQFRITGIAIKFIPMVNSFNVQSNSGQAILALAGGTGSSSPNPLNQQTLGNPGLFGTVIDYDDADTTGYTLATYEQYQNFKFQPVFSGKIHRRYFTPHCVIAMEGQGGPAQPVGIKAKQWVDVGTPNINWYGIKIYLDAHGVSNVNQYYQVMATYYVQFKNVR